MSLKRTLWAIAALSPLPFALASQLTTTEPTCEQVYKDIKVFQGVPAKDLIPAMEFMAASLKVKCTFCHEKADFSAPTRGKDVGREMVLLQRDINTRHFNNRLSVTCMSCHNGREHPLTAAAPEGTAIRHQRVSLTIKPDELFKKFTTTVGPEPTAIIRKGTITTPGEEEGKTNSSPVEFLQAKGGKFKLSSQNENFGSNGQQVWRSGFVLSDEPAAIFGRMGRAWRGDSAFDGLNSPSVVGKEKIGKASTIVVRGTRASTGSTEELYFDEKSGLLVRFVSMTRSTLGPVFSTYDYADYKSVGGVKVPMKVTATFPGGEQYVMVFKSANTLASVEDSTFEPAKQ